VGYGVSGGVVCVGLGTTGIVNVRGGKLTGVYMLAYDDSQSDRGEGLAFLASW
jgi:hypothetical protein